MSNEKRGLDSLNHVKRDIPGGGEVYVLDNGAIIDSEAEAMLQALHSRSTGGINHHLGVLEEKGADNFMSKFYVGYGHKSIGDCGSTTIFIEGVSMLAAKAIQDGKLYSGQEASTRYVDFSEQRFVNPLGTNEGKDILESEREFYLGILNPLRDFFRESFPIQEGEREGMYEKAIGARAFDVARGFLPAGASTNLAWHSNLRQISDRLLFLRHHPLREVRNVAETIEEAVMETHPNSFSDKRYPETEDYQNLIASIYFYQDITCPGLKISDNVDVFTLGDYKDLINARPEKTELPKFLSQLGKVSADFKLDFGSFRDLQRHRAIEQRMPLLTTVLGFNEWYLENMPSDVRKNTEEFLMNIKWKIESLDTSPEIRQYYIPMGYNVANSISGDLPSMVYMAELRSTSAVHPTLRKIARDIGNYMQDELRVRIHLADETDRFDIKRGDQDITLK